LVFAAIQAAISLLSSKAANKTAFVNAFVFLFQFTPIFTSDQHEVMLCFRGGKSVVERAFSQDH
jgi:hypothetical protein